MRQTCLVDFRREVYGNDAVLRLLAVAPASVPSMSIFLVRVVRRCVHIMSPGRSFRWRTTPCC